MATTFVSDQPATISWRKTRKIRKSWRNNQTSKKNNRCSKNRLNGRQNEHLYITIDANILTKATESKSKRPDPNPENPNEIQIQRLIQILKNPEESKSNISNPDPENNQRPIPENQFIQILKIQFNPIYPNQIR